MASTAINLHFNAGEVRHDYREGSFATLDIGSPGSGMEAYLHFKDRPELVDKVIAELVALRAEMTGDAAPELKVAS